MEGNTHSRLRASAAPHTSPAEGLPSIAWLFRMPDEVEPPLVSIPRYPGAFFEQCRAHAEIPDDGDHAR